MSTFYAHTYTRFLFVPLMCATVIGLSSIKAFSQNIPSVSSEFNNNSDSTIAKKHFFLFSFFKKIFSKKNIQETVSDNLKSKIPNTDQISQSLSVLKQPGLSLSGKINGSISVSGQYYDGTFLSGPNGWYTTVSVNNNFSLFNTPFSVNGNLVLQNNEVRWSYSTASINFDYQQYLEGLKSKLQQKAIDQLTSGISLPQKEILDSLGQYEAIREQINDSHFTSEMGALQYKIDSLKNITLQSNAPDSLLLDSLKEKLSWYQNAIDLYAKLFSLKAKYAYIEDQIQNSQNLINDAKQKIALLSDPQMLKSKLTEDSLLKPSDKLLLGLKAFNLGSNSLCESKFTANDYLFNGLLIDERSKSIFASIAIGVKAQVPPSIFNNNFDASFYNQRILFAKAGIGNPDSSYSQISVMQISDVFNSSSNFAAFPKSNFISSFSVKRYLSKSFVVYSELAHADLSFKTVPQISIASEGTDQNPFTKKLAFIMQMKQGIAKTKTEVSLSYQYVGPSYITLGNPYLINNAHNFEVDLNQKLFKDKLSITSSLIRSRTATDIFNTPKITTNILMGQISYLFGKLSNTVSFCYSPNYVISDPNSLSATHYSNELFQFQGIFNSRIGDVTCNSIVMLSNFQNQSTFRDTFFQASLINLFCMENITFSSSQSVSINLFASNPDFSVRDVQQYHIQLLDNLQIRKSSLSFGAQLLSEQFTGELLGYLLKVNIPVWKTFALGVNLDYKNEIGNQFDLRTGQLMGGGDLTINW